MTRPLWKARRGPLPQGLTSIRSSKLSYLLLHFHAQSSELRSAPEVTAAEVWMGQHKSAVSREVEGGAPVQSVHIGAHNGPGRTC